MAKSKEEIKITHPDGKVLTEKEAEALLRRLQRGIFYIPQRR